MTTTNETSPEYVMDEFDGEIRVYIDDHGNQGTEVGQFYQYETAARFVHAVNAHDELVEALTSTLGALDQMAISLSFLFSVTPRKGETVDDDILQSVVLRLLKDTRQNRARAALAKAALAKAEGA